MFGNWKVSEVSGSTINVVCTTFVTFATLDQRYSIRGIPLLEYFKPAINCVH